MKLKEKHIILSSDTLQVADLKKQVNSLINFIEINFRKPQRYFTREHKPLKGKGLKLRGKILGTQKDQSMPSER